MDYVPYADYNPNTEYNLHTNYETEFMNSQIHVVMCLPVQIHIFTQWKVESFFNGKSTDTTNIHFIDITEEAFMEFAKWIDPLYQGETVNWLKVDKSKLYSQPKFSDKSTANDYSRKYGFTNDPDFDYVKSELKKMGRKPKEVNLKINNK